MYLESSKLLKDEETYIEAAMPADKLDIDICLTFHVSMYSVYANEMGSLTVIIDYETADDVTLWYHQGVLTPDATSWHVVHLPIKSIAGQPYTVKLSFVFVK